MGYYLRVFEIVAFIVFVMMVGSVLLESRNEPAPQEPNPITRQDAHGTDPRTQPRP